MGRAEVRGKQQGRVALGGRPPKGFLAVLCFNQRAEEWIRQTTVVRWREKDEPGSGATVQAVN
jgi:hypothetical protein